MFIYADGCEGDILLYKSWGELLLETGFSGFYAKTPFCDYPPGFLYILLPVAFISRAFSEADPVLFLKTPAIICDLITAAVIYRLALARLDKKKALLAALFCALSPMTIFNSAVWGQTDSIFSLFLILCVYLLTKERFEAAAAVFALSLAFKPQAVILAPVFLFVFVKNVGGKPGYWLKRLGLCAVSFFTVFYALMLPFANSPNPLWIIRLYLNTFNGYNFISMNAYNLWWALGAHWAEDSALLGPFSYLVWGYAGIAVSMLACWLVFRRTFDEGGSKLFFTSALLFASVFMLSCRMHERYLVPAALLFLAAFACDGKPLTFLTAVFFTFHSFVNQFGALFWDGRLYALRTAVAAAGVAGLIAVYVMAFHKKTAAKSLSS